MSSPVQTPTAFARRRPMRWLVLLGAPIALGGGLGYGLTVDGRAALSFLGGLLLGLLTAAGGAVLVEFAATFAPRFALAVAMTNYVILVLFFLLLLGGISPAQVDVPAFAVGLAASVLPYVAWQLSKARVRPEAGQNHT